MSEPIEICPTFRHRVWGREDLAPYFVNPHPGERIGEVWFTLDDWIQQHPSVLGDAADPQQTGVCPLLLKLLFTSERLSVQVHPDDEYARKHHSSFGKTEAWIVLDAQPPGELAVGFRESLPVEKFRVAAVSGEIDKLLAWRRATPGEVVLVPAGSVHAIGAGLTICEIQQNSDITYRLYDYGRPRELHLDHGAQVSRLTPHDCHTEEIALAPWRKQLAACEYFRIERLHVTRSIKVESGFPYFSFLLCIRGTGCIGGRVFKPGGAWFVPAGNSGFFIDGPGSEWLFAYKADSPAVGLHLR